MTAFAGKGGFKMAAGFAARLALREGGLRYEALDRRIHAVGARLPGAVKARKRQHRTRKSTQEMWEARLTEPMHGARFLAQSSSPDTGAAARPRHE